MKLLADENIESEIVAALRSAGHLVFDIKELSPGVGDKDVLATANETASILLTNDKDFGELIYRDRLFSSGVMLLRFGKLDIEARVALLTDALDKYEDMLSGSFAVITPTGIRIRR
jgi:predicted nuclease of predicted toxin-antitoxin system